MDFLNYRQRRTDHSQITVQCTTSSTTTMFLEPKTKTQANLKDLCFPYGWKWKRQDKAL